MTQAEMNQVGFRWTKPTWERAGDRSWVLIVPSSMAGEREFGRTTDPQFDRTQRFYEIYNFDGSWFDQLHEVQIEWLLRNPTWRDQFRPHPKSSSSS
ncbi:MAG: hypothetical protein SFV23_17425 [Planctomycetaceae bacterium]|nr:hypothetical protein [Planctomycetaceae bacterium]